MSIKQIITCSVCGESETEESVGMGFVGWGALQGIIMDGEENPTLCPFHLSEMANCLDDIKKIRGIE